MNAAADLPHKLEVLRSHCAEIGRDPATITVCEQVIVVLGKDDADVAQRWAMAGGRENFEACAQLLALAPRPEDRNLVVTGLSDAFVGGKIPVLPPALATALDAHVAAQLDTDLALGVKTGNPEAVSKALAVLRERRGRPAPV